MFHEASGPGIEKKKKDEKIIRIFSAVENEIWGIKPLVQALMLQFFGVRGQG